MIIVLVAVGEVTWSHWTIDGAIGFALANGVAVETLRVVEIPLGGAAFKPAVPIREWYGDLAAYERITGRIVDFYRAQQRYNATR